MLSHCEINPSFWPPEKGLLGREEQRPNVPIHRENGMSRDRQGEENVAGWVGHYGGKVGTREGKVHWDTSRRAFCKVWSFLWAAIGQQKMGFVSWKIAGGPRMEVAAED